MTRDTVQKRTILAAVRSTWSHPTADWVYGDVRKKLPHISLGTVYRNLKLLVEAGDISELEINGSSTRYDRRTEIHGHFMCQGCNSIWDVDEPAGEALSEKISRKNGFRVTHYQLTFHGLCEECRKKEKILRRD